MPFLFVSSAATAAAGLGLVGAPTDETGPARALALFGAAGELTSFELMRRRLGPTAETYSLGRAGRYHQISTALTITGTLTALLGHRHRGASAVSGAVLLAASATTRWSVFHAGIASATDPRYTVEPQRRRLQQRHRE
jgi:hypothetical protein